MGKNYYLNLILISMLSNSIISCDSQGFLNDESLTDTISLSDQSKGITIHPDEESYYWYKGEKIILKPNYDYSFQVIECDENLSKKTLSNSLNISKIDIGTKEQKQIKELYWTKIDNRSTTLKSSNNTNVIYESPYYKDENGNEVGISHLFYVKLKQENDLAILQKMANEYGVLIEGRNEFLPLWYTLSCNSKSKGNTLDIVNKFYESGLFEASEPSLMVDLLNTSNPLRTLTINDKYFNQQWNLNGNNSINWNNVKDIANGSGVTIGVFDEGIEPLHEDLNSNLIVGVYDTKSKNANLPKVVYGTHGTRVTGIIAATIGNGKGICGIAHKSNLFNIANPLVGTPDLIQQLANGFSYASSFCDVINCSWSGNALKSSLIDNAIHLYCETWGRKGKGTIVVFSSGNDRMGYVNSPGCDNNYAIRVGASTKNGKRLAESNFGDALDVVAPGEDILTINLPTEEDPQLYNRFGYTSGAAPHVSAVAALILSVNPNLTANEVKEIIESTAQKVGGYLYSHYTARPNGKWNPEMGYGLVDAYAAVIEAKNRLTK